MAPAPKVDYLAEVKRYAQNADEKAVAGIVKHLGIALKSADAALVSCSSKASRRSLTTAGSTRSTASSQALSNPRRLSESRVHRIAHLPASWELSASAVRASSFSSLLFLNIIACCSASGNAAPQAEFN